MDEKLKNEIVKEAERIEECCVCSSKSHYNTSKEWNICNLCFNIPIAIIASISIFVPLEYKTILAIITAVLAAVQACIHPTDCTKIHKMAADKYLALKNQVRRFKNIELLILDDERATKEIKRFGDILDDYNTVNPQPSKSGYKKAQEGIKNGEADFNIDTKENQ